ncbi:MAG: sulfatase [Verrucomicrobiota bacterium]
MPYLSTNLQTNSKPVRSLISAAIFFVLASSESSAAQSPNFILILTDDHGWTSTSTPMDAKEPLSQSDYHETPNLDRLARSGMRFSQGYSPGAICTPTRRSVLFGQTPIRMGEDDGFDQRYDPYEKGYLTIPNLLKSIDPNYRAAHLGKWHIKSGEFYPEEFGFDESDGSTSNEDGSIWEHKEDKWKKTFLVDSPKRVDHISERGANFIRRNAAAGHPFYLQLSYYATHVDIQTKPETYAKFSKKKRGVAHDHPGYAGMLHDLDTGIGRVLDQVEQAGISDRTYIIMMADNGGVEFIPPSGNKLAHPDAHNRKQRNYPLRGGKWVLYEGGIRVPFLIAGPGIVANSQSDVPVAGYDLLPTLGDLAGHQGSLPDYLDGGSLKPLLLNHGKGEVTRADEGLYFHRYATSYPHTAIRLGDFKLIKFWSDYYDTKKRVELYNLSKDLGETNDLASKMPQLSQELENRLLEYLEKVGADFSK